MIDLKIEFFTEETKALLKELDKLGMGKMPSLENAVEMATSIIMETWVRYGLGNAIPNYSFKIENPSGNYAKSIKRKKLGKYKSEIFSDSPYAAAIEYGQQAYDMKTKLLQSPKARKSDRGTTFLIIPFFHKLKSMPKEVKDIATKLTKSYVLKEPTAKSHGSYIWGGRTAGVSGLKDKLKNKNFAGIVRMDTSTGKKSSSSYLSFRVVSSDPLKSGNKWMRPAVRPKPIATAVTANTVSIVEKLITKAVMQDLGIA